LLRKITKQRRYKRDEKLMKARGMDMNKLDAVVFRLASGKPLEWYHRDHKLTGKLSRFRECHIEFDWLLVYRIDDTVLILELFRTGKHSDVFKQ
jgi:mRNA interferase YafQ